MENPRPGNLKSEILRRLVRLPPMPQAILKARELLADPDAGSRDLVRVIEQDPALVAKTLALANSAYFGVGGQVASVTHAALLLGFRTLSDLLTLSAASVWMERELESYRIAPRDLWRHALASALAARRLARARFPGAEEEAFVAALLHDAGKVILDPFLREAGPGPAAAGAVTPAFERERLGLDHAEVMALACRFWRYPESLVKAIQHHHAPSRSERSALAFLVHAGHGVACLAGCPGIAPGEDPFEPGAREFLGLASAELRALAAAVGGDLDGLDPPRP